MTKFNLLNKKQLEKEVTEASQKYYTDGTSSLTDEQFDKKLNQLKHIDPNNELVTRVGHGYSITLDSTYGQKYHHEYGIVGSLDKVHNWKELSEYLCRDIICSLKLDGISCVLYYKDSQLVKAVTRGDGTTGIDITEKVLLIDNRLSILITGELFTGAVRGELVMKYSDFNKFKKDHKDAKNPRNTVAGLINQKEYSKKDISLISFVCYSVMASNDVHMTSYRSHVLPFLEKHFSNVVPYQYINELPEYTFDMYMSELLDELNVSCNSEYPFDGIVIASDTLQVSNSKDITHITWRSQAYKFPSESKSTIVREVVWNFTKTGYIVPRIRFDPIELSGTTVEYATAFNAKYVLDNNLMKGTQVTVTKSGEIIPYIVSIDIVPEGDVSIPYECPECDQKLVWNGVHLCCQNDECSGKKFIDLIWWIKTIAPVGNLSNSLIEKFSTQCEIDSVEQLYDKDYEYYVNMLSGTGKQEQLFLQAIHTCLNNDIEIADAVRACNIPRFGERTCILCRNVYEILVCLSLNSSEITDTQVTVLKDKLGTANTDSLLRHITKLHRISYLKSIHCDRSCYSQQSRGDVCITGKLSVKRKDFEQELKSKGWNVVSSVKKNTTFLITDDPNSDSSKNKAADRYNISRLTESEFRSKYID